MLTETAETMPLRTSDDVVRLRQAVRARAVAAEGGREPLLTKPINNPAGDRL